MCKILVSHPIHSSIIEELHLEPIGNLYKEKFQLTEIDHHMLYHSMEHQEILYIPGIAIAQVPDEANDPTLIDLAQALSGFKPDVLIVGNNAVPEFALGSWREALLSERPLLVIRRGVDTRAIDKDAAHKYGISVSNLPGINSPFVAEHMIEYLELEKAKAQEKMVVLGIGNIAQPIICKAIEKKLKIQAISPSLQEVTRDRQVSRLQERGIDPDRLTCAESLEKGFEDASYVVVAVPWEHPQGGLNAGMIDVNLLEKLSNYAKIVSCSPPRIFSADALAFMNAQMKKGKIYVRIDTAKRLAQGTKAEYPHLDIAYDRAFAAPECQRSLDRAWLKQAQQFCHQAALSCLVT